jgi:hypothetical protein
MRRSSAFPCVLLATVVAGCLDISSAFVIYIVRGIGIPRGLRGIASGLLGREMALQGGWETSLLGLALHFFIMFCVVVAFYLVSRAVPWVIQHPLISGLIYGPLVYLVMYWVVVPLSRIGPRPHSLSNDSLAIAIHIFLIGLPIALIVSRFSHPRLQTNP